MTDVLPPTPDGIRQASALLANGAVIAFPTDTVYGVGWPARDRTDSARCSS